MIKFKLLSIYSCEPVSIGRFGFLSLLFFTLVFLSSAFHCRRTWIVPFLIVNFLVISDSADAITVFLSHASSEVGGGSQIGMSIGQSHLVIRNSDRFEFKLNIVLFILAFDVVHG